MAEAAGDPGIRAKEEFKNFLDEVDIQELFDTKVKGKFLLIKYKHDENREEDFLNFLFHNITTYALIKDERDKLSPEASDQIIKLTQEAISRFVTNSTTGEFGEIILFHLLELMEGAVQIVNKMALKTSGKVHYHGGDAVHFGFDGDLKVLYLGESKTIPKFSTALRKSLEDTDKYYKEGKDEFDIKLATGNISDDIPMEQRELIKKYLNPETDDLSDFKQVHAIFLGYQYDLLKDLEGKYGGIELVDKVIESYKKDIAKYIKSIEKKIKDFPDIKDKRFLFFIIPFKDLDGLRDKFAKAVDHGREVHI